MALLNTKNNPGGAGSTFTGLIDPNLLALAMGSSLLGASGPSPYRHGTFGLGLSQGIQNYFGLLPTLEKIKQMQLQHSALANLFRALETAQQDTGNPPATPPQGTPQETSQRTSFGLPNRITLKLPGIPDLNERLKNWLSDKVNINLPFTPSPSPPPDNITPTGEGYDPFGIFKKKDLGSSVDRPKYPMLAHAGTVGTDAPPPTVPPQQGTGIPGQPVGTVTKTEKSQEPASAPDKPGISPEEEAIKQVMDTYQKLYKAQQSRQMQRKPFPLTFEQMMVLKAITGIDLFGAYETWLKSRTPMVVGAGNYLINPETGEIIGSTPTGEGVITIFTPNGIPVALPIPGFLEAMAQYFKKVEEGKHEGGSKYKFIKLYTRDGTSLYLTEYQYKTILDNLNLLGLTLGNIGLYAEPTSEAKEKTHRKQKTTEAHIQIAAKQFENILKLGDVAQKQYPIVELLENEIEKLARAGANTGPTTELQILFERYLSNALGANPPETLIGKILIGDIGKIIGLLIKGSGEDSLSPGNLNQAEQQFWSKMGPDITDPIQVMWAKLAMFKEVIDRQKTKAEMAQNWVADFGSLIDKGKIYNPVTKRVEEMTWNEYWNKYIEYRGNMWLKKMKEFPWRLKQK